MRLNMNKIIIILLAIVVVIIAMVTAVFIYVPEENNEAKVEIQDVAVENTTKEEENVIENTTNMLETSANQERISPNAFITFKQTYKECGHTTSEFVEVPQEFVNLNEEELKERYSDWSVEKFTDTDIVLNKEVEGSCNEHYVVRDVNGTIIVFCILDDGTEEEYMITDIATEYLTDTDKIEMKNGIKINGKQNLNQLIEDYE